MIQLKAFTGGASKGIDFSFLSFYNFYGLYNLSKILNDKNCIILFNIIRYYLFFIDTLNKNVLFMIGIRCVIDCNCR